MIAALRSVSRSVARSMEALDLGPTQRGEVERNRTVTTSALLPAIERYTGVVYDSLDAPSLPAAAHRFIASSVVIHSALFGLVRASDPIPAYRLSHDSRLPGLALRRHWHPAIGRQLGNHSGLMIDMRSAAYVALGAAPSTAFRLRVIPQGSDGRRLASSQLNKSAKGLLIRAIASAGIHHETIDSLVDWATENEIGLALGRPGELELSA